jgi:hypothetical protein
MPSIGGTLGEIAMKQSIQVAICGQSIAWAAVEVILRKLPNINIIHCTISQLQTTLTESPDIILCDSNTICNTNFQSDESISGPPLLKLDFDSANLVEPLNCKDDPMFDELILAIQGEYLDG